MKNKTPEKPKTTGEIVLYRTEDAGRAARLKKSDAPEGESKKFKGWECGV
jgi:hypothetical protein